MRGVVFERAGAVRVGDLPEPRIEEPGDAVVEVTRSAICGSDLHPYHGRFPMNPGESLGHEAVGVVREVGEEVRRVASGDRVIVAFDTDPERGRFCAASPAALVGLKEAAFGRTRLSGESVDRDFSDVALLLGCLGEEIAAEVSAAPVMRVRVVRAAERLLNR